jgi:hypothetical protein
MKLVDFNKLNYDKKLYIVVDEGIFLDNYITSYVRINLYSVHSFYVELIYNDKENKIVEVRSFSLGVHLDKYIN